MRALNTASKRELPGMWEVLLAITECKHSIDCLYLLQLHQDVMDFTDGAVEEDFPVGGNLDQDLHTAPHIGNAVAPVDMCAVAENCDRRR